MAETADYYADMATKPGWWAYTQQTVISMEEGWSGVWVGLRAMVGQRIKAAGFKPNKDELGRWWDTPSKVPYAPPPKPAQAVKPTGWRAMHQAYQDHAASCQTCTGAGIRGTERCEVGGPLWATYQKTVDHTPFMNLIREPHEQT